MAELAGHISLDSITTASRFLDSAFSTMAWLTTAPKAGSEVRSRLKRLAGLRRWPIDGFPNHLIIYRPVEGGIEVVRIFHGASNWPTKLRREPTAR